MNYYIGIDNSSFDHKVRVLDQNGNMKMSFTITNTFDGFEKLEKKIINFHDARIGFELPHGPIVDYLHNHNHPLYSLNPLKIKRFKESPNIWRPYWRK